MTITNKDKKLLVYLLAVGIVALVYLFVARPYMDKQQKMLDEIDDLKVQVKHYGEIYANQEAYETKIADAQTQYNETLNKFFGGLNQENTIINIKGIEEASDTWISRISFQETQMMDGNDLGEISGSDGETSGELVPSQGSLSGVKQNLNLDYTCQYKDFKRFIEYIQNYDQRLFISSIETSYSLDSNKVSGSLVLTQYAVLGAVREYEAPDLSGVGTGVDNIFTTLNGGSVQESFLSNDIETIEKSDEEAEESEDADTTVESSESEESGDNTDAESDAETNSESSEDKNEGSKRSPGIM